MARETNWFNKRTGGKATFLGFGGLTLRSHHRSGKLKSPLRNQGEIKLIANRLVNCVMPIDLVYTLAYLQQWAFSGHVSHMLYILPTSSGGKRFNFL